MSSKHCPHCNCITNIIRKGYSSAGRQRYLCRNCNKTWVNRPRKKREEAAIWRDFVWNNLPVRELSKKYHKHENTIRNILHNYQPTPINLDQWSDDRKSRIEVIMIDATYFGRGHGVIVAIDAHTSDLLYFNEIFSSETNSDYEKCIKSLLDAGIRPKACVIDGRKGVRNILEEQNILVQICQFHLKLMVRQHLTNNPVLEPNKELKFIIDCLCSKHSKMNKNLFYGLFVGWHHRHLHWMSERTYNLETGKKEWTHQDTRRAFAAIKNHLDILFTYEEHPELNIPKTSNRIEGLFGMAKDKLRIHHGYTKELKIKIFFSLLSGK